MRHFCLAPFINCSRRVNRRPAVPSWPFLSFGRVLFIFNFPLFPPLALFSLFVRLVPTGERTACRSISRTAAAAAARHAVYKNARRWIQRKKRRIDWAAEQNVTLSTWCNNLLNLSRAARYFWRPTVKHSSSGQTLFLNYFADNQFSCEFCDVGMSIHLKMALSCVLSILLTSRMNEIVIRFMARRDELLIFIERNGAWSSERPLEHLFVIGVRGQK